MSISLRPLSDKDIIRLSEPDRQLYPVVLSSPHSGQIYPDSFLKQSRLDQKSLARSEDSFVDLLFHDATKYKIPMIAAQFPRSFIDPNREAYELDPTMFIEELPEYANISSSRVSAGLGTIAKVGANGEKIYHHKLHLQEAEDRLDTCYRPYHQALTQLLRNTHNRFGFCLLLDCHSMPSSGSVYMTREKQHVDFVLGDCYGASCHSEIMHSAAKYLRRHGYSVLCNMPYAGGYITKKYGDPKNGYHSLQIEINRTLYMDESKLSKTQNFAKLQDFLTRLVHFLATSSLSGFSFDGLKTAE